MRTFFLLPIVFVSLSLAHASSAEEPSLEQRLRQVMDAQEKEGFWGVVFVSQNGETLLKDGYGMADRKTERKVTSETIVSSGSLSKQITATAAVALSAEGKLSLNDPLSKYFDGVPDTKADITVRQLLSHTSGLESWIFPNDFIPIPREVWLEKVFGAPLKFKPGERYHYSNDGVTLVAMIIEKVVNDDFKSYIHNTYFTPLGMNHTGWFDDPIFDREDVLVATGYRNGKDDGAPNEWPGPYWALLGNGGILWSVDDMKTWHEAIQGDLLTQDERNLLFQKIVEDPERDLYPSETGPMHYGLGWRIGVSRCGDVRIGHTGTGLTHNVDFRYYKDRDILIYAASNRIDVDYKGNEIFYARRAAQAIANEFMRGCQ